MPRKRFPQARCVRCGLTWTPTVPHPKACPRCHSYYWNVKKQEAK